MITSTFGRALFSVMDAAFPATLSKPNPDSFKKSRREQIVGIVLVAFRYEER